MPNRCHKGSDPSSRNIGLAFSSVDEVHVQVEQQNARRDAAVQSAHVIALLSHSRCGVGRSYAVPPSQRPATAPTLYRITFSEPHFQLSARGLRRDSRPDEHARPKHRRNEKLSGTRQLLIATLTVSYRSRAPRRSQSFLRPTIQ